MEQSTHITLLVLLNTLHPSPPEDEEVEEMDSLCFVETLRDPLQRAIEKTN
jgi:hypothetical protein